MKDLRAPIRAEMTGLVPCDALEARHIREALAWVDSGAVLCRTAKPATPPVHLVSYFVVRDHEHLLLVDHRNAGLWLPPGGHVEPGEHPRDTVRRELHEELGLGLAEPVGLPRLLSIATTVGATAGHTDVSLWYVVNADRRAPITFDAAEFHGVRWFARDELPFDRSDPHLRRFVAKLFAAAGQA